jgi:hypothetical protein
MSIHPSIRRSASAVASAALLVAGAALSSPAQGVAMVSTLGPGCGSPPPVLSSTMPVVPGAITFHIADAPPFSPVTFFLSPPPAITPFTVGFGCTIYVNPLLFLPLGPIPTDANGDLFATFFLPDIPELAELFCSLQALVPTPEQFFPLAFSNGVGLLDGTVPPFCSYAKSSYQAGGAASFLVVTQFESVFSTPGFLEVGVHQAAGGSSVPNGIRFTADTLGRAAMQIFMIGGGTSGAFGFDAVNPFSTSGGLGGGALAKQTIALTLNVAFNDAGVAGSFAPGYSSLVYHAAGDSLDGLTVAQLLATANAALAGLALPAGHSFASLEALVENLNLSFDGCGISEWARLHLFAN